MSTSDFPKELYNLVEQDLDKITAITEIHSLHKINIFSQFISQSIGKNGLVDDLYFNLRKYQKLSQLKLNIYNLFAGFQKCRSSNYCRLNSEDDDSVVQTSIPLDIENFKKSELIEYVCYYLSYHQALLDKETQKNMKNDEFNTFDSLATSICYYCDGKFETTFNYCGICGANLKDQREYAMDHIQSLRIKKEMAKIEKLKSLKVTKEVDENNFVYNSGTTFTEDGSSSFAPQNQLCHIMNYKQNKSQIHNQSDITRNRIPSIKISNLEEKNAFNDTMEKSEIQTDKKTQKNHNNFKKKGEKDIFPIGFYAKNQIAVDFNSSRWECNQCTYRNPKSGTVCEICFTDPNRLNPNSNLKSNANKKYSGDMDYESTNKMPIAGNLPFRSKSENDLSKKSYKNKESEGSVSSFVKLMFIKVFNLDQNKYCPNRQKTKKSTVAKCKDICHKCTNEIEKCTCRSHKCQYWNSDICIHCNNFRLQNLNRNFTKF